MSVNLMNLDPGRIAQLPKPERLEILRTAVNEVVGVTFFGQMLKTARANLRPDGVFRGGRGEQMFGAQLDQELARRAAQGMRNGLSETLFERWSKKV